jgi:hypothetical protein
MKTRINQRLPIVKLLFVALLPCASVAGCVGDSADSAEDGELLFNLTEAELLAIHDTYLPDEDLELTRARLTAPFDCALYDDFCVEVGRDAAIELTARQVELALEGAPLEVIEADLREGIAEASALWSEVEHDADEQFRDSGPWATRTKDDYRLRVQNGITTPLIGNRKAWTEAKMQKKDWLGVWGAEQADQICVNTGTNEQVVAIGGGGSPTTYTTIESINPAEVCLSLENSIKNETFHDRNSGWENGGLWSSYTITARGCGNADVDGVHFGICADDFAAFF